MPALDKIDPAWAWAAYEPSAARPWTRKLAAHLHRRAGFAATTRELDDAAKLGPAACVARLFPAPGSTSKDAIAADFQQEVDALRDVMSAGESDERLTAGWLYRMLGTPAPLLEKTTLFWHGHFATSGAKVREPRLLLDQNELLRSHALGKFGDLVLAISRDPAMLQWLDASENRKARPNENYARELMELFCLGEGHYTERDIKEVARAFTGWELRQDRFVFNKYQHDEGVKAFLGSSGNHDGGDAVRIVLDQPAAPRFIAGKLIRFFVLEEPAPPAALVEPVARALRENGFAIAPVLRMILGSNLFFSEHAVARKVRSPVELAIGLLRAFEARTDMVQLAKALERLGQAPYFPPNVKGWDGGRTWLNSSTLLGRANLVADLLDTKRTRFGKGDLGVLAARAGASTPGAVVDWLSDLLLAAPLPAAARSQLVDLAGRPAADDHHRIGYVVAALAAQPEFQLA